MQRLKSAGQFLMGLGAALIVVGIIQGGSLFVPIGFITAFVGFCAYGVDKPANRY